MSDRATTAAIVLGIVVAIISNVLIVARIFDVSVVAVVVDYGIHVLLFSILFSSGWLAGLGSVYLFGYVSRFLKRNP